MMLKPNKQIPLSTKIKNQVGRNLAAHDVAARGTEYVIHNRKTIPQQIRDEMKSDDFKDRVRVSVGQALAPGSKIAKGTTAKIEQRRATNRLARVRAEAKTQLDNINETIAKAPGGDVLKQAQDAKKDLEKLIKGSYLKDNKRYQKLKTDRGRTNFVNRLSDKLSEQVDTAVAERAEMDVFMRKEALFNFSVNNSEAMRRFFWGNTKEMWYHKDIPPSQRKEAVLHAMQGNLDEWAKNSDAADYINQVGVDKLKENMSMQDALEILMRLHGYTYEDFVNSDTFLANEYELSLSRSVLMFKGIH